MANSVYDDQQTDSIKDLERSFAGPNAETSGSDIAAKNKEAADLEAAYNAPAATESGSKKLEDAKGLAGKEDAPPTPDNPINFTGGKDNTNGKKRGFVTKKRASITGVVIGLLTGTLTIGGFLSGPLEFLHFAESIRIPHFSATEHFTDSRLGKIFLYSRTNSVGDTRLNLIERQYKNRILASMEKIGITPATPIAGDVSADLDYLKDWKLDSTVKGSPLEGMDKTQMYDWAKQNFGSDASVSVYKDSVYIKTKSAASEIKTTYILSQLQGKSKIASAARTRILGKFFDTTFHPMKALDKKINTKTAELYKSWKETREKAISKGTSTVTANISEATKDANGNPTSSTPVADGPVTTDAAKSALGSFKDFLSSPTGKASSGVLLGAGVVCMARQTADNVQEFKYTQVIVPLIRTGMEIVSLADQIKNGADVDTTQLDFYAQQFVTRDDKGKIVNSWSDAKSIQANNGGSGGVAVSDTVSQSSKAGVPAALQWTQSDVVTAMCSGAGQAIQLGAGVVSLFFGAGIVTELVQAAVIGVLTTQGINLISNAISGEALVPAVGAELGGRADYGVALAANAQAMQFGGNTLSSSQLAELNQQTASYEQSEFQSKSLIARVFDVNDRHSFASQVVDSNVFDTQNTIASIQEGILSPLKSFGSLFSNIFSSTHAFAATPGYDYGFPTLGFSLEDQKNPLVAIPQENAAAVGTLLDSSNGQTYIARASKCYGVNITKGNDGWDVIPGDTTAFKDTYAVKGSQDAECTVSSSQDPNWLRVRFFIADTSTIEGWACTEGDDTSCANDGFGGSTPTTTTTTGGSITNTPTGTTTDLAKQIAANPNITFQTPQERTYFQSIIDTGSQTACGGTQISSRLLGTILALSQKYALVLGVFDDGHGCTGYQHQKGQAVDINGINPLSGNLPGTGNNINWSSGEQATLRQFYTDAITVLIAGGGGALGQLQCFTSDAPASRIAGGVVVFNDSCNHVHMDVGNYTNVR